MSEYKFDRYVNGKLMAEGCIVHAENDQQAARKLAKLCCDYPVILIGARADALAEVERLKKEIAELRAVVTDPIFREGLAMLAGKEARDRRNWLIGAAEELERLAQVNQHRMLDCNDLTKRAAQLRREADDVAD